MRKIGLGKGRGKFELKEVRTAVNSHESEVKSQKIYDSASRTLKPFKPSILNLEYEILNSVEAAVCLDRLTLDFMTPTRLVYDSHFVFDLEFHMLIRQLLRRVSLLGYFHCGSDPAEIDFPAIIRKAADIRVTKRDFRWYDWERYSARQDARMKMGGFVGEITFEGDIAPFMSLIQAGEVLHVGKGTGFGLGKYEVTTQ